IARKFMALCDHLGCLLREFLRRINQHIRDCLTVRALGLRSLPGKSLCTCSPNFAYSSFISYFGHRPPNECLQQAKLFRARRETLLPFCLRHRGRVISSMTALQSEIERRGKRVFELVDKYREPLFSKTGFYQRLMTLSMHDEQFKTQLFRFVAVLPSLRRSSEIIQ